MASLFTSGRFQAINASGVIPGAKLYTMAAGTSWPGGALATYTTQAGTSSNANPVICNANGQASVWLGTTPYHLVLTDANDVTIWDVDGVGAGLSASDIASTTAGGAGMVGYGKTVTYPANTVGKKLQEVISVADFGAVGDGDAIAVTGTNNYAAFTAAIAYAMSNAVAHGGIQTVFIPRGTYGTSTRIQIPSGVKLMGDGAFSTTIFPLSGFNDAAGVLNTVESGLGQPPSGIYDLAVSGNYFVIGTTPAVVLNANASVMERVWVGGFAYTHIKCWSTNQILSRCIIDNAIPTGNSVGIEIVSPGVQIDTCTLYAQETGISVHDVPTNFGKVPIQITDSYVCNPIGSGYGLIIANSNAMPVHVSDFVAMSDLTTGYAGGGVCINNSPNVHIQHSRVEFPGACTQSQIAFNVLGTSTDVTLNNCSSKFCNIGVALQGSYATVRGGVHVTPTVQGVDVTFGTHNTVDGVTTHGGGIGFTQNSGADRNVWQNNQALGCTTGYSIAAGASSHTYLKNNHSDCTADYSITGTTNLVMMRGNTNAAGAVEGPSTTVTVAAASYTLGYAEESLIVNNAGTCTVTLPAASTCLGRVVALRTVTANAVVSASSNVVPSAGGSAGTAILAATAGKWAMLRSDGTNWQTMASN